MMMMMMVLWAAAASLRLLREGLTGGVAPLLQETSRWARCC
jgi:hypothetical protein